jgi:hypothetical protein
MRTIFKLIIYFLAVVGFIHLYDEYKKNKNDQE